MLNLGAQLVPADQHWGSNPRERQASIVNKAKPQAKAYEKKPKENKVEPTHLYLQKRKKTGIHNDEDALLF